MRLNYLQQRVLKQRQYSLVDVLCGYLHPSVITTVRTAVEVANRKVDVKVPVTAVEVVFMMSPLDTSRISKV